MGVLIVKEMVVRLAIKTRERVTMPVRETILSPSFSENRSCGTQNLRKVSYFTTFTDALFYIGS
jgi:hypothetical protein